MASCLMMPQDSFQNPLNSYFTQLEEMEMKAVQLITECATRHRAKQEHVANVKSEINKSFGKIIDKLQRKQSDLIGALNQILNETQKDETVLSSITSIINQQKAYLSHAHSINDSIHQINSNFNASKQLFATHVATVRQSMNRLNDNDRITEIMHNVHSLVKMEHDLLGNINQNASISPQIMDTALLNHSGYNRLQLSVKPTSYFHQYAPEPLHSFVMTVNILTEHLPNKIIQTLMDYVSHHYAQIDATRYLAHGWEQDNTLYDAPDIYVDNALPIVNQPSLILTIGLPGSGKTTWAKIRVAEAHHHVIAADDYFDKFNEGRYKVSLLRKAHEWCQSQVDIALKSGHTVVANNTNTSLSEMYAYCAKVVFGELPHKIVFAVMPETSVYTLSRRGVHGVSVRKIRDMLRRMRYWLNNGGVPSMRAVLKAGPFRGAARTKDISKDVVYSGIFMDGATQNILRRYFVEISGAALLESSTDCHLTLKYQPLYRDVERIPFGKKVRLKVIGYVTHRYIQCFIVDILDDAVRVMCANKYAHITMAYDESITRPFTSNDAIQYGKMVSIVNNFDIRNTRNYGELYRNWRTHDVMNGGLIIEGKVGAFYKNPGGGIHLQRQIRRY